MKKVNVLINSPEKVGDFIQILQKYNCDFDLESGRGCVDAKSLIGVMSLNLKKCVELSIHADDAEATKVIQHLQDYVID